MTETVLNGYAHAFPKRNGVIHVNLTRDATEASLTISDDGIGFVEPPSSKRHGLGLVRRLMEQIEGRNEGHLEQYSFSRSTGL